MTLCLNDGGRAGAGYRGKAGDCVCRAVAIATGQPYSDVYGALNTFAELERPGTKRGSRRRSSARAGIRKETCRRYLKSLGWRWVPTMGIGTGCRVHLRADELPPGRLLIQLSRHMTAVIDGCIHDTHDPSRGGTRCVYGYWLPPVGGFDRVSP